MDFPADPPRRIDTPRGLAEALGVEPIEVWVGQYLIAVLAGEGAVRGLAPDIRALEPIVGAAPRAVAATSASPRAARPARIYDVVSRFFAPGSGIDEDPATGSLHCILSPLFSDKLGRARPALPPGLSGPWRRTGVRASGRPGPAARPGDNDRRGRLRV